MEALYFLNPYLRVIHIVAAVLWVGVAFTATLMIVPAQQIAGQSAVAFTKALYGQTPFGRVFAITGGLTVLAGLLLYATGSNLHFTNLGNAVLGIGAVAGIAAAGHGSAVGKYSEEYHQAALAVDQDEKAENITLMTEKLAKLKRNSTISLIMVIVALVFMSSARYL
jgi:uncharacterized membrane protein